MITDSDCDLRWKSILTAKERALNNGSNLMDMWNAKVREHDANVPPETVPSKLDNDGRLFLMLYEPFGGLIEEYMKAWGAHNPTTD